MPQTPFLDFLMVEHDCSLAAVSTLLGLAARKSLGAQPLIADAASDLHWRHRCGAKVRHLQSSSYKSSSEALRHFSCKLSVAGATLKGGRGWNNPHKQQCEKTAMIRITYGNVLYKLCVYAHVPKYEILSWPKCLRDHTQLVAT